MPDQAKVSRPSGSGVGLAFPDDVQGFPCGSAGKESACNAGDPSSIPGSRRSAGEAIGYPLQYSLASGTTAGQPPCVTDTMLDLSTEGCLRSSHIIQSQAGHPGSWVSSGNLLNLSEPRCRLHATVMRVTISQGSYEGYV